MAHVLSLLTDRAIARHFDHGTLRRGRAYLEDDAVATPSLDLERPDQLRASAKVAGTRRTPYIVLLSASSHGGMLALSTRCTCPVLVQCKHGAALALKLGGSFTDGPIARTWEQEVSDLLNHLSALATDRSGEVPLALQLTWPDQVRRSHHATRAPLTIRPLRPGKRGNWIKAGISWQSISASGLDPSFDPDHVEALGGLAWASQLHGGYWYAGREAQLGDFGPDVVALLRDAVAAGVELVVDGASAVHLAETPAELVIDTAITERGGRIATGLQIEGDFWPGELACLAGDPAHTVVVFELQELTLAPLRRTLPRSAAQALLSPPITVPAESVGALPDAISRLRRVISVGSFDGSVAIPEPVAPRLRLTITWASAARASRTWDWAYGDQAVGLDRDDPVRDPRAERELLARLPQALEPERREISGADVLHLALLELPGWRECPEVDVVEIGAPDFRESDEGPEISFDLVPGDGETHTDWLDLEVTITVESERVMLAQVLAALTLGHEHLVLPSGLFVRTDRPEFARLDDVVRAAAELRDPEGDRVSVGHHDLGLWAQLAELGVVDQQAAEWVRRAQALRDLVELPRPEPTGVVSTLRPYQLDGFHWLAFLWQHGLGGVLADDMGLGKTLQVLALVAHARAQGDRAPFLVVAPTSVVGAWVAEAERHTPGLRVRTIDATAVRRDQTVAAIAADADIVVTSYTLHRLETEAYEDVDWGGLVLDEAHFVKNHQSKAYSSVRRMRAPFRLAVTGTPFENRLMEYWALLSIAAPGIYPHPRSFTDNVVRPVEKQGDEKALRRFTGRIKPFVLRRTKELVADDLPPKVEQVLEVELAPKHRKLYDTHLAKERQRILGLVDDFDRNRVAILAALTKLRQLALDPALVDDRHDKVGSAKVDVLVEHLLEVAAEGHRALVFSTFTGFLTRVRQRLDAEGIGTSYLDGRTKNRAALIEDFRSGDQSAFLISLKAGGVGLTLTEADYVFVLDPWWNPAAEAQAVDRAHRIGQHKTVMVYRLVSTDTIEDKVMALKARKAELFRKVIDGDGAASQAISADDIRALFD